MAVLYYIWVPAFVVAHLLGLGLLLYSLEKVSGGVSKTCKRLWHGRSIAELKTTEPSGKLTVEGSSTRSGPLQLVAMAQTTSTRAETREPQRIHIPYNAGLEDVELAVDLGQATLKQCQPRPMDLSWSEVACDVLHSTTLEYKQVLKPCSGIAKPGQVVAFLGPSGAGKSTLLDILAARKTAGKLRGQVLVNGRLRDIFFNRISAYVPQEEVFVPTMSALETISFHAKLSLPHSIGSSERKARIIRMLTIMGLYRSRHTTVGGALPGGILVRGLSGGEKRRLAIACALVASPSILFLDEPTTGLDSFAALSVMEHMSALAALGHTIITTIHQPRPAIWEKFIKVVVLSEGYQLFWGEPHEVQPWFSGSLGYQYEADKDGAVSDWVMDLVSIGFAKPQTSDRRTMSRSEDVAQAAAAFAQKPVNGLPSFHELPLALQKMSSMTDGTTPSSKQEGSAHTVQHGRQHSSSSSSLDDCRSGQFAASWWTQFRVLFKRALLGQLRNPTDASCRMLMSCWVGVLAGLVFFSLGMANSYVEERLALLFFVLLLYELLPFCYMSFYVADRRFFAADIANGLYHPSAYYCAAIVAGAPFVLLNTAVGTMTAYGLSGMRNQGKALVLNMVITGLQSLISTQLQIFCVWLTPNQDLAYVLATSYVATSILVSGFYIRIIDMRVSVMRGLSWLSYTKYAMQGVSRLELSGRQFSDDNCPMLGKMQGAAIGAPAPAVSAQPMPGGANLACATSGEALLDYWGYTLSVGEVAGILVAFYAAFHLASYLALSRLYRQRR